MSTRPSGTGTPHRDTSPPGLALHAAPRTVVASATGALAPSSDRLGGEHADPDIYAGVNAVRLVVDVLRGRREGP